MENTIATKVSKQRKKLGLSIEKFSKTVKLNPITVRRVERGNNLREETYEKLEKWLKKSKPTKKSA